MKKFMLCFLSVIVLTVSILFVGCNDDDSYIWAESKTFNNKNFTITASVDYEKDDSYGDDVLVLEGLNGKSIVVCYNEGNSTISSSLSAFKQDLIKIDNIELLQGKSGSIEINKDEDYLLTEAEYFSYRSQKTWQNSTEKPEREKFYVHYNLLVDEFYYNWLVVTAKAGDGFVVAYIGGRESSFNKKFNEYLTYAKSLLVKPIVKNGGGYENVFSSEMEYTSDEIFATSGVRLKVPKDFKYYMLDGVIQPNLITADLYDNNNRIYGEVSVQAYEENWTSAGRYSVLNVSIIEKDEFEINKHLVKIGSEEILGYYYKRINLIENEEHYQGEINEVMYFKAYANDRTYAFKIIFNIYYEDDVNQSDYNDYVFHSVNENMRGFVNDIENQAFEWVKTIELF